MPVILDKFQLGEFVHFPIFPVGFSNRADTFLLASLKCACTSGWFIRAFMQVPVPAVCKAFTLFRMKGAISTQALH